MKEIYPGIWKQGNKELFTVNLVPGTKVYAERLIKRDNKELRFWDPHRSKLSAAILNGLKTVPFQEGTKVLYLGAATGTTPSHISDIVKKTGIIYAIEFSEKPFRSLQDLSKQRENIAPIIVDARKPEKYSWIEKVDVVYVDVADPQETEISIRNCNTFLKEGGYVMIAVKSQSIDVTKQPEQVYKEEAAKLEKAGFKIVENIKLDPYETAHAMIVAQK